jgi:hypothetical protein
LWLTFFLLVWRIDDSFVLAHVFVNFAFVSLDGIVSHSSLPKVVGVAIPSMVKILTIFLAAKKRPRIPVTTKKRPKQTPPPANRKTICDFMYFEGSN